MDDMSNMNGAERLQRARNKLNDNACWSSAPSINMNGVSVPLNTQMSHNPLTCSNCRKALEDFIHEVIVAKSQARLDGSGG